MAQPKIGDSYWSDKLNKPMGGEQQAAITATTATQAAVTDALDGATFTGTALTTGATPTVDELETAFGVVGKQLNAAGTDIAALIVTVNAIITALEAHGLVADN